jgi:DNA mismatch repair ATPase MutS
LAQGAAEAGFELDQAGLQTRLDDLVQDMGSQLALADWQAVNGYDDWTFDYETAYRTLLDHFKVASLEGYGCSGMKAGVSAAGAALRYIEETQKTGLSNIRG